MRRARLRRYGVGNMLTSRMRQRILSIEFAQLARHAAAIHLPQQNRCGRFDHGHGCLL